MQKQHNDKTKQALRSAFILLLGAMIWGSGFVAQRKGMEHVGPFTFLGLRFLLGALTVLPLALFKRRQTQKNTQDDLPATKQSSFLLASLLVGLALFAGSAFQQVGLLSSTASKAGFITALYLVLVPLFGLFFRRSLGLTTWLALLPAIAGLYFLTIKDGLRLEWGDAVLLISTVFWTIQILLVDHFSKKVEGFALSCGEFFVAGVLGLAVALIFESPSWAGIRAASGSILFSGVLVAGIGFTFQVLGQSGLDSTPAALIMSLEAVFAALFGVLILGERLSGREWVGCVLMAVAVVLSQIPRKTRDATTESSAER